MLLFSSAHLLKIVLVLFAGSPFLTVTAQTQCDLENQYMLNDIAIPSLVTSNSIFQEDYVKVLTREEQVEEARQHHSIRKRAAVRDRSRIWPDNIIPYVIDEAFQSHSVSMIHAAMETWSEVTCVRFLPRTTQQDYLDIKTGRRCCSYVGRQKKGGQKMKLDHGCMVHGILLHELGHVIGFWHEQNRPDRDQYIEVIPNYHESVSYNFDKRNESEVDDYGVEYDYASIMHYGETFFSKDGRSTTLKPKKEGVQIGQRLGLSPLDTLQANRLYMCQEDCNWSYNASQKAGNFTSRNFPNHYPIKTDCIVMVFSKPDQIIGVNFEVIDIEPHSDCSYDYLEVRDGDLPYSPLLGRFCGKLPAKNFTSSGPNLWVKFHSDSSVSRKGFFAHFVAFNKEDSKEVTKMDPCSLKTCEHTCKVIDNTATCTCPRGYSLNEDGFGCRDQNECMHNNGGCSHICLNSRGSFSCQCPRGYILGFNGLTCQDVDECLITGGSSPCDQICINTPGSYYCECRQGYRLTYDYRTCIDYNECSINNGGCDQECTNSVGSFQCGCFAGYTVDPHNALSCRDEDECARDNGGCAHFCHNTLGHYYCSCNSGYFLDSISGCSDVDECELGTDSCEQLCENVPGSYSCSCREGFEKINGNQCRDVDECRRSEVKCIEGECVNSLGGYYCACPHNHVLHPDNDHFCILGVGPERETEPRDTRPRYYNPVCGSPDVTGEPALVTSPRYPSWYPTNSRCSWTFSAQEDEVVEVTILSFDLERERYCSFDSLRIYDGRTTSSRYLAVLCGTIKTKLMVKSTGRDLLLKFKSDLITSRPGFKVAVDYPWVGKCGGRFVSDRQSRTVSWKSSDSIQCMWTIFAPRGNKILLNFIRYRVFGGIAPRGGPGTSKSRCTVNDAIEIYDSTSKTLLDRFCKTRLPTKLYIASASKITIVARALSEGTRMDLLVLYSATQLTSV